MGRKLGLAMHATANFCHVTLASLLMHGGQTCEKSSQKQATARYCFVFCRIHPGCPFVVVLTKGKTWSIWCKGLYDELRRFQRYVLNLSTTALVFNWSKYIANHQKKWPHNQRLDLGRWFYLNWSVYSSEEYYMRLCMMKNSVLAKFLSSWQLSAMLLK